MGNVIYLDRAARAKQEAKAMATQLRRIKQRQSVDGTVANSGWRMTSTVGGGGTSARISAYARINTGDTWKQAGWFINVTPTGSQFIVVSNQFANADPNNNGTFTYVDFFCSPDSGWSDAFSQAGSWTRLDYGARIQGVRYYIFGITPN
ncbi:hypothetical protein [Ochrobactrum teleogrylli]